MFVTVRVVGIQVQSRAKCEEALPDETWTMLFSRSGVKIFIFLRTFQLFLSLFLVRMNSFALVIYRQLVNIQRTHVSIRGNRG